MNAMQALQYFWAGFGWPAYNEYSVPDEVQLPYITYEAANDFLGETLGLTASLWDRSPSWGSVMSKEQEISDFIGRGGRAIAFDGGIIWIKRGTPWSQRLDEPSDSMIRRIVLNLEVEFIK